LCFEKASDKPYGLLLFFASTIMPWFLVETMNNAGSRWGTYRTKNGVSQNSRNHGFLFSSGSGVNN
jgi:hypothetical protein